jgi:hypothetical protein
MNVASPHTVARGGFCRGKCEQRRGWGGALKTNSKKSDSPCFVIAAEQAGVPQHSRGSTRDPQRGSKQGAVAVQGRMIPPQSQKYSASHNVLSRHEHPVAATLRSAACQRRKPKTNWPCRFYLHTQMDELACYNQEAFQAKQFEVPGQLKGVGGMRPPVSIASQSRPLAMRNCRHVAAFPQCLTGVDIHIDARHGLAILGQEVTKLPTPCRARSQDVSSLKKWLARGTTSGLVLAKQVRIPVGIPPW